MNQTDGRSVLYAPLRSQGYTVCLTQDTMYASACDWTKLKTPFLPRALVLLACSRAAVERAPRSHGVSVAPPVFIKVQSSERPAHWSMNKSTTSCTLDFCRTSNDGKTTTPMQRQRLGQPTSWSLQTGLIAFQYICKDVTSLSRQSLPKPVSVTNTSLQYRQIRSCFLAPRQTYSTMNYFDSLHFGQDYMILPNEESQQTARSSNITSGSKNIMIIGVLSRTLLTPVAQL